MIFRALRANLFLPGPLCAVCGEIPDPAACGAISVSGPIVVSAALRRRALEVANRPETGDNQPASQLRAISRER